MNILILNWRDTKNPFSGGAELATLEHAKNWVKNGHSVTWFCAGFPDSCEEESIDGVRIVRQGNFLTVYLRAFFYYFKKRSQIDLVVDEIHGLPFFTPFYVRKKKLIYIHEVAREIWDYIAIFPFNLLGKILEPLIFFLYRNEKFMTVSESTKRELVDFGIKKDNISVIYNGLSLPVVKTLLKKEKKPTYLFVNRLVKMKGIEDIIAAFSLIKKRQKDAQLWIVGAGNKDYQDKIKNMASGLGRSVVFWGKVDENKKIVLLKKAHILLHASVKEGWGLIVIEAASQGTPAVVYNSSGLRDSVLKDKTGIILDHNSPKKLADEAINLLSNRERYRKMQERGLTWAKQFSWAQSTEKSENLITSL